ncbi:MAG: glycosyltransferase family 39 protein [Candidatus Omnitrophica bacterium]|nr:glycosyltransferase family 39 protein [Candidatus Omnitrophota bacterium]
MKKYDLKFSKIQVLSAIKTNWCWIVLGLLFWAIVFNSVVPQFFDTGGDSAQYITVAESVASGQGLRMLNYPGEPICVMYPPVFPLLLSSVVFFFGRNFYLMYLLVAFLGFLSLIMFYHIFKKYSDSKMAFFTIFFLAVNWNYIIYCARYIRSEIPYLFFSACVLFMLGKYIDKPKWFNRDGLFLILTLALTYFTRHIGVILFFSVITALWFSRKEVGMKKILLVGGGFLVVFLGWNVFKFIYRSYVVSQFKLLFAVDAYALDKGTFLQHPEYIFTRFVSGIDYYSKRIAEIICLYPMTKWQLWQSFAPFVTTGLIFLGLWRKFIENRKCVLTYYFLFYFFLVIFWPFHEGIRFLVPLMPLLIFYFLIGTKTVAGLFPKKLKQLVFLSVVIAIFAVNCLTTVAFSTYFPPSLSPGFGNFVRAHGWISENLPEDGVICSRKPRLTYLYTGHQSLSYKFSLDPDEVYEELLKNKIKYLVLDEFSTKTVRYLLPMMRKYSDEFKLLLRVGNTSLMELNDGRNHESDE